MEHGFKKYWETHKDKSLPDQREDNTGYMRRLYEEIQTEEATVILHSEDKLDWV